MKCSVASPTERTWMPDVLATAGALRRQRVIPVLRSRSSGEAVSAARALAAGGLRVIELTLSTPGVHDALRQLVDDDLVVGLGTLRTADDVGAAHRAGATFVVSFANPPGFLETAAEHAVLAIPGVLTPNEALAAHTAGAAFLKLFPARAVGPDHVRDLRTVLPEVPIIATGGIPAVPEAILQWLDAGTAAVGLGGSLATATLNNTSQLTTIARDLSNLALEAGSEAS
jgi:2-dehydro-3-deoxyphosphogluconate aldolase/(4S)-4-hydroxy-2-oxoglutarate aldolase